MKIRITGKSLPKHQEKLVVGELPRIDMTRFLQPPPGFRYTAEGKLEKDPGFDMSTIDRPQEEEQSTMFGLNMPAIPINPSLKRAMDQFNKNNKINLQTGSYDPKTALDKKLEQLGVGRNMMDKKQQSTTPKLRPDKEYNYLTPLLMNTGLGVTAGIMKSIFDKPVERNRREDIGMTDSLYGSTPNVYSRGRNEINTGAFAPNQMTPIQFAGRPMREYYGFAQEGLSITGDVLGLGELYADPESYKEPVIPTITRENLKQFTSSEEGGNSETLAGEDSYVLPIQTNFKISSGFGPRRAPKKGASTFHRGLDLSAPIDTPVYSVKPGVVKRVFTERLGGKVVTVKHNDGSESDYLHLNDWKVKEGDPVGMGQLIALSGNTGNSTGPHLHFTYRLPGSKENVDPRNYFNFDGKPRAQQNTRGSSWVNNPRTGQVSYTHNNPLNLHFKKSFAESYGAVPGAQDGKEKVAKFSDLTTGIQANVDVIMNPRYQYKKDGTEATIEEMRNRWVTGDHNRSPEDNSSQEIVKALGKNYKFSELTPELWDKLFKEFARWEGKQAYNYVKGMDFKPYFKRKLRFQEGGEYELSDQEIQYILANGGQIEYL